MAVPETHQADAEATMRTLSLNRLSPGVLRMTSMLTPGGHEVTWRSTNWDETSISTWFRFPGVSAADYTVRRFDAGRRIVDIDFSPSPQNTMLKRWLDSIEVGASTRIAGPGTGHLPNFDSGRRALVFADEASLPAVRSILEQWPSPVHGAPVLGTVWIDTPDPAAIADLPVVDGVGVISFHIPMGFDPLVTAARRCELNSSTTVWAAGERERMDAIRATCMAAGLSVDDTRVFGYWSDYTRLRRS